ncbi:MAG: PKD domain-containing protein, partial [Candidatus Stygibacter frigidus]|nr:PKD domain-containing protein [Candidatus Stygibacter frigidus]
TIRNNANQGIYCDYSSPTISNNTISNNGTGIYCDYYSSPTISNNLISNNDRGVYCYDSSPTISNNTISNNSTGVYCDDYSSPVILNNILYTNENGIYAYSTPESLEHNLFWLNDNLGNGSNIPAAFGEIVTVNANGDSCDTYCNLFMDPMFVAPYYYGNYSWTVVDSVITFYLATQENWQTPYYVEVSNDWDMHGVQMDWTGEYWTAQIDLYYFGENPINYFYFFEYGWNYSIGQNVDFITEPNGPPFDPGNFDEVDWHLLEGSPCIDAGNSDPVYYDPDGTVADMGALYFDQGSPSPVINDFTGEPISGTAPLVVQFTQSVTGPVTEYNWSFGDASTSMLANPVHVYTSPGIYSVTLIVTGPGGVDSMTFTDYISVLELQLPPSANFCASPLFGIVPLETNFTNMSTGEIESYLWEFGDSNTSSEINPVYEYQNPGLYTVTLTAYGIYGNDIETKTDYIEVMEPEEVMASFTVSGNNGCIPYPVIFTNQSVGTIDSLLWDFGDGDLSFEANPVHTYETAGVFEIVLTVYGQLNSSIAVDTITVQSAEPQIISITDRPEDQGGYVYLTFSKSYYDTVQPSRRTQRETESYSIQYYFDETWIAVSSVLAMGEETYTALVETYADNVLVEYRVIAGMDEGTWISESTEGTSLDNLAPAVPTGLRLEGSDLVWDAPGDNDFNYFTIYLDNEIIDYSIVPLYDATGLSGTFQVTATDFNGNESDLSNPTGWFVNPFAYEYNCLIWGIVMLENTEVVTTSGMLSCFVDDECRGVATIEDSSVIDYTESYGHVIFLPMIYSNVVSGEILHFQYYDQETHIIYNIADTLEFTADMVIGDGFNPFVFHAGGELDVSFDDIPPVTELLHCYPNPFNPETRIDYKLSVAEHVKIEVYNIKGQKIAELLNEDQDVGRYSLIWNAQDCNSGIYFIRLTTESFSQVRKAILLK